MAVAAKAGVNDMSREAKTGGDQDLGVLRNAHHVAYRCRDAEQTRWFYEDVLGFPMVAALALDEIPGLNEPTPYLHLFFQMGNGDMVAFFDEPRGAEPAQFERAHSFDRHLAFEAGSEEELLAWQARINAKGVSCLGPVDHGFVKSVYMYDPNGLQVEITARTADYDRIMDEELRSARSNLAEWTTRTRELKVSRFGAEAIDRRSRRPARASS